MLDGQIAQIERTIKEQQTKDSATVEPAPVKKVTTTPASTQLPTVKLTNNAWDQSDKFVKIYLSLKGVHTIDASKITHTITNSAFDVLVSDLAGKNYTLGMKDLLQEIIPEQSQVKTMENGNGCVMAESDPYAASAASPVASTTAEKPSHSSEAALNLDQKPDEIAEGAPKLPNSDDHPTLEEPAVSGTAADSTIDAPLLESSEAPMGLASMPSSCKKSPMGTGTADDPIYDENSATALLEPLANLLSVPATIITVVNFKSNNFVILEKRLTKENPGDVIRNSTMPHQSYDDQKEFVALRDLAVKLGAASSGYAFVLEVLIDNYEKLLEQTINPRTVIIRLEVMRTFRILCLLKEVRKYTSPDFISNIDFHMAILLNAIVVNANHLLNGGISSILHETCDIGATGRISLNVLLNQYRESRLEVYRLEELLTTYSDIRMIRRDGNCFYRSLLVAQLEIIYTDTEKIARFESVCIGWHERLIKLGFPGWTAEDFCHPFNDFIRSIKNKEKTLQQIMEDMNDDHFANYMIIFVRMMASGYIKEHADDYKDFIAGYDSVAEFCASEIEGMWKDADHIAVTGLVHAIGVPIRVEYMDRVTAPDGGTHYDFPQGEDADPEALPKITLLYRPGHYDLIYRK